MLSNEFPLSSSSSISSFRFTDDKEVDVSFKTQRPALLVARMKQNISSTYLLFDNDTETRRRLSGKTAGEKRRRSKCNHVLKVLFSAQHDTITVRRRLSSSSSQRAARCSFIFPGKNTERKQTTAQHLLLLSLRRRRRRRRAQYFLHNA